MFNSPVNGKLIGHCLWNSLPVIVKVGIFSMVEELTFSRLSGVMLKGSGSGSSVGTSGTSTMNSKVRVNDFFIAPRFTVAVIEKETLM